MDLKLLKMLCKDSKQHHVMFHELYSVSSLLCIAQNVRFEIPYKVLYFETPFLMIFKYYAWASYECTGNLSVYIIRDVLTVVHPSRKNGEVKKAKTTPFLDFPGKDVPNLVLIRKYPLWRIFRKVARFSQQANTAPCLLMCD